MSDLNSLIDNLAQDARMPRPTMRLARSSLMAVGALIIYAVVVFVGSMLHLRSDLIAAVSRPLFAAEIASLVLLILSSVVAALAVSVPDMLQKPWLMRLPIITCVAFLGVMATSWIQDTHPVVFSFDGVECLACITGLSLLPAAFMFYKIKQLATIHPDYAGLLATLCAFGLGALLLRLSEQTDSIAHIVSWHYAPMLATSILGFIIGPRFLKW